jgi:hypothetical protein
LQRRVAAILCADVAGYARLIEADEALATDPTRGTTARCLLCDRGVSFSWPMLIDRHGPAATWAALGRRFRCRECGRPGVLEVHWREHRPNVSWREIVAASEGGGRAPSPG